ncbi:MAG: PEGA domain-containing protein [Bdellovibrio sp.]
MFLFKTLRELLFVKKDICLCMIVSEQEGAEIWIDGKPIGEVTPKLVSIPRNKPVKLTLKLTAHKDHVATVQSPHNLSYYYCQLQRVPLRLVNHEIHHFTSV